MSHKHSDSMRVAVMLTIVGGFLDVYTFMLRGGTFANAQTGNIVMTGVNIALGQFSEAAAHLCAIIAFVCGILCSVFLMKKITGMHIITYQSLILILETIILVFIGFIPLEAEYNNIVVILISFVTAMQYEAFKKMKGFTYATTMCTGMLRSATELLYIMLGKKHTETEKSTCIHLYLIIFTFCVGCAVGAVCCNVLGAKSVWLCSAVMIIVSGYICIEERERLNCKEEKIFLDVQ